MKYKIFFIVPFFGTFPNYFQLWLNSCGNNSCFNWLILTDGDISCYNISKNVSVKKIDLNNFRDIIQQDLDINICLNSPYKLCDFRPLYWKILDFYNINYDFWGHCDIDVFFGDLSKFLTNERLKKFDRIYSEGHLSLMRNNLTAKNAYKLSGGYDYKEIFQQNENIGFDEHHGVNKKWINNKLNFYFNKKEIIDIDPQFKRFSFTYITLNLRNQFFFVEDKSVFRGTINKKNQLVKQEFAYIHFQKRKMDINIKINNCKKFLLSENGFTEMPNSIEELKLIVSKYSSTSFFDIGKIKRSYRFLKNKFINGF
tara:strand:+ start:5850 stop:6785 length:936 start_codon:yes stop_codon:yes gene_type:complete